ncbi:MAG: hypothetical protein ACAH24_07280 [Hyphomicrobiaceae bacterium]
MNQVIRNLPSISFNTIGSRIWTLARALLDLISLAILLMGAVWAFRNIENIVYNDRVLLLLALATSWLVWSIWARRVRTTQNAMEQLERDLRSLDANNIAAAKDLWGAAAFHRRQAALNILFLIVVLLGTSIFMIAAGYIANWDYGVVEVFEIANRELEAANKRIPESCTKATALSRTDVTDDAVRDIRMRIEWQIERSFREGPRIDPTNRQAVVQAASLAIDRALDDGFKRTLLANISEANAATRRSVLEACTTLINSVANLREFYAPAFKLKYEAESARTSDGYRILRSMVLRISFGAFALYLATVLLHNYRYNVNISNAYRARFGTVVMGDIEVEKAVRRAALLTVDNLKIGKEAHDPLERLVELLKGLTGGREKTGQ